MSRTFGDAFNTGRNLTGSTASANQNDNLQRLIGASLDSNAVGLYANASNKAADPTRQYNVSGAINIQGVEGKGQKILKGESLSANGGASYLRSENADAVHQAIFGMNREDMARYGLVSVGDALYGGALVTNQSTANANFGLNFKNPKGNLGGINFSQTTGETVAQSMNRTNAGLNIGKGFQAEVGTTLARMQNPNRMYLVDTGLAGGATGFMVNATATVIRNGRGYSAPIGAILSALAAPNPMAVFRAIQQAIPHDVDLPRYRVLDASEKLEAKDTPNVQMFKTGETKFNPEGEKELKRLVSDLQNNPTVKIELNAGSYYERGVMASVAEGFRAAFKGTGYNADLSAKRAEAVRDYLIQNGIDEKRISMQFSERTENDTRMAVQDYGTNVRLMAEKGTALRLQDSIHGNAYTAQFNSELMSPVALKVAREIQNSQEFKAFIKDKSDRDAQIIALGATLQALMKPEQPLSDYLTHLKEAVYDKGLTATTSVAVLSDDEMKKSIMEHQAFQAFAQTLGGDKKELDAVLETMVDARRELGNLNSERMRERGSVEAMIDEYRHSYQSRGLKLSEHEKTMKGVDDYFTGLENRAKTNPAALSDNERAFVQAMSRFNNAERELFKEGAKALFNGNRVEALKDSPQFDERYLVAAYNHFYNNPDRPPTLSAYIVSQQPDSRAAQAVREGFQKTLAASADYKALEAQWKTLPKEQMAEVKQQVETELLNRYLLAADTQQAGLHQALAQLKQQGLGEQAPAVARTAVPSLTAAADNKEVQAAPAPAQEVSEQAKKAETAAPENENKAAKVTVNMAALDTLNTASKPQEPEKPEVQKLASANSHSF